MNLRESVRSSRVPVVPNMPARPRVAAQEEALAAQFDAAKALSPLDADALVRRLRDFSGRSEWDSITFREWKKAVWVLFGGNQALSEETGFFDRLLEEYRQKNRRGAYHGLVLAYLRDYDPGSPPIRRAAKEIGRVLDQFAWPWKQRDKNYQLFSEYAPETLAKACLSSETPLEVLRDAGVGGARAYGGLAACAYGQAINQLKDMLSQKEPNFSLLDRILSWSVGPNGLAYPKQRAALATSLLVPWSSKAPPEDQKDKISNFLLAHFHDPRLPINAKDWVGVDEDAVAVLRKWLTGVALEQFFVVVDQVAQESMWRYRRSFWLSYYNADAINDAWVLFGREAQSFAKRAFGKTQSYGRLEGGQVQSDHSVLLMKIGKLTVADWSHNGKCNIWRDGSEYAPKLYRDRYARPSLVQDPDNDGQAHHGSEHGTWQRKIASYIRQHSGISVSERNYMPDDRRY